MRGEGKGKIRNNVILTDFWSLVENYYAQGTPGRLDHPKLMLVARCNVHFFQNLRLTVFNNQERIVSNGLSITPF
jgi:hypothetical protein